MIVHQLALELEQQSLPEFMRLSTVNPRPSREAVWEVTQELSGILFPGYFRSREAGFGVRLATVEEQLTEQIRRALCFRSQKPAGQDCQQRARILVADFLARLPELRRLLGGGCRGRLSGRPFGQLSRGGHLQFPRDDRPDPPPFGARAGAA